MIYFVQRANGDIKIGYTIDVEHRLVDLAREFGNLELLGIMSGDLKVEAALHQNFAHCWVEREFFWRHPELLTFIRENAVASLSLPFKHDGSKVRNNLSALMQGQDSIFDVVLGACVSVEEIYNLCDGKTTDYDVATIERLCRYFGCDVGDLLYIETVSIA